ncbi:MAG TPA: hypothetical protein RMH99_20700 [Sandaracinaceae bacterium LLY-WYZ-13_1]|nr:hypothetical protein [Sandaracinaceae bacterium LLY-WYZ-13_1]
MGEGRFEEGELTCRIAAGQRGGVDDAVPELGALSSSSGGIPRAPERARLRERGGASPFDSTLTDEELRALLRARVTEGQLWRVRGDLPGGHGARAPIPHVDGAARRAAPR